MIRHIVGWTLVAETTEERAVAAEEIRAALEGLVGVVDELIDLVVVRNGVDIAGNSDLALIAHFATASDLEAYIVNADHQKAAALVGSHTTKRWAIDFEV
jgi:hypothetical protein